MKYWKRYISFTIGTRVYSSPPFALKFESSFGMKGSGSATASIYNPSEETIQSVAPMGKINQVIIVDAGYEDDHGICVMGEIYDFSVIGSGLDRILEMKISEATTTWANKMVNKTWSKGITASAVVYELVSLFGIGFGIVVPGSDRIYPNGISLNTKLRNALEQMAKETESHFFIRNGLVYFIPHWFPGIMTGVSLSPNTGLLGKPEKTKEGWKIQSLFNYKVGSGEMVSIESASFAGDTRVVAGSHYYSEEKAHTKMEVVSV